MQGSERVDSSAKTGFHPDIRVNPVEDEATQPIQPQGSSPDTRRGSTRQTSYANRSIISVAGDQQQLRVLSRKPTGPSSHVYTDSSDDESDIPTLKTPKPVTLPYRPDVSVSSAARYYDRVAVLLIRWADELDDLNTRPEIVELNVRKKPQHQLDHHVQDFVIDNDGPNHLLIIYYSGSGQYLEDERYLEIVGPKQADGKGMAKDARANWNKVEERLRNEEIEADVVVILDTCFASNHHQTVVAAQPSYKLPMPMTTSANSHVLDDLQTGKSKEQPHKLFELLSACGMNQLTAAPGEFSFTRALIDVLGELLDEDQNSAFSTYFLIQRVNLKPERRRTPAQLWSRLYSRDDGHIRLGPLRGPGINIYEAIPSTAVTKVTNPEIDSLSAHHERVQSEQVDLERESELYLTEIEAIHDPNVGHDQDEPAIDPCNKHEPDAGSLKDDEKRSSQPLKFDDAASDSAYESGFSDTASMWSVAFSEGSQSSIGELQHVTESATKKMAEVFWQSSDLRALYSEASNRLSKEAFAKAHDDLLKTFFANLRSETANDKQLKTVRVLRHRTHRQQVTEWMYGLAGPKLDSESLQARHNFLNQREDRDELLESFLQSQAKPAKAAKETEQEPAPAGDSSDEEEEDTISLEELNAIVKFLVSGSSFEILKINLHGLAHPETAIQEALRTGKVEVLQALLSKQFNRVAVGEYGWIQELDAAGYTKAEIAQLLAEETMDSPWIFFTPQVPDVTTCEIADPRFHVAGCIHSDRNNGNNNLRVHHSRPTNSDTSHGIVQELCGIAGVAPASRDKTSWNGSVQFSDDNDIATVTYGLADMTSDNGNEMFLARSIQALQSLLGAIPYLQGMNACCNAYSMIIHDESPAFTGSEDSRQPGAVELHKIRIRSLLAVMEEAQKVQVITTTQKLERSDVFNLQQAALDVLAVLGRHHFPSLERLTYEETLHLVALSVQFASLAFLSYSQAHIAPIQPVYLDTALNKVFLMGIGDPQNPPFHIVAQVARLTCLGDMLRAPVIVFNLEPVRSFRSGQPSLGPRASLSYDIIASAEDLIGYHAIDICGGVIAPVSSSHRAFSAPPLFHWDSGNSADQVYDRLFQLKEPILVGAFVSVNDECAIDENQCWRSSAPAFEVLGAHDSIWRHDESQYGGQAGQYALLQYNRTKHKIPGTTLKTLMLRSIRNEAYVVRHSLNDLWGVQVSFCTGVARRVPLRVLMADLIPVVLDAMPRRRDMWQELNKENRVLEAFLSDSVLEWLDGLARPQSDFIDQVMQEIFLALESTGVDEERNELTVAWVFQRPPYRCFRVPYNDKKNSWMRVLSDSSDCATFAYIVTRCLETSTVKCRGPSPHWHSTAPLLETAVLRHNLQPSQSLGPLENRNTYFFKKVDSLLQVTVEKKSINGPVTLYISPSSIPAKFRQRLYNLERMRSQVSRIRERRESGELGAEAVAICTKTEMRF
ncbi:hypothetical protein CC86DRAFT_458999 [Ophiobolus disseminans]|uniref:Uncharacterized protein n=1 Tax=Ophiobolus disseminans TaxID=1469910 RepID=A0A6A6ZJP5_9PLEO|nr:hypothetical protein CC86DRAFT_458999 [Ophiobolus disseminans]